jgi:hypothetical protein
MARNAGKAVRYADDLHAEIAADATKRGETIAEWCEAAARARLGAARASITVPSTRARTPRRAPAETTSSCPHPMSVRIGNRCGRCGQSVR